MLCTKIFTFQKCICFGDYCLNIDVLFFFENDDFIVQVERVYCNCKATKGGLSRMALSLCYSSFADRSTLLDETNELIQL